MPDIQDQRAVFGETHLTRREREILSVLADDLTVPEIADKLMVAPSSVRSHIKHLYGKLGATSKRQAINRGRELGLLLSTPPAATRPDAAPAPGLNHNLPLQVTRFFGREPEIVQIIERLDENRLATLTGPGGVGKTRLALRIAEEVLPDFPDGVWLVELASLSDAALIAQQVAASLGLRDDSRRPFLETLQSYLRERQLLLVLDSCEHLLPACGRLVDSLLRAAPGLRVLASSREPFGIAGEAVYSVPPLAYPDPDHLPQLDRLRDYPAVSLFIDRARLVLPDYQVKAANAVALARICQQLDGLPLAIEMAAARLNILTAAQLADRLNDALGLLTGGSRSALLRQQTLQATVDWSYHLLNAKERLLFQRLSVFAGGFTLEAAEAVCADPARNAGSEAGPAVMGRRPSESPGRIDAAEIVHVLATLVAKSMVSAGRRQGAETRYRLLEVVRQYAWNRLAEAGDRDHWRQSHCDFFLAFAEANAPELDSSEPLFWAGRMAVERENFRRALEWSFSDGVNVEAGPRLLVTLPSHWTGHQENYAWCMKSIAWRQSQPEISSRLHVALLQRAAQANWLNDPQAALVWSQQAVEVSRRLGRDGQAALIESLEILGWTHVILAESDQALATYAEAQSLLEELGPQRFPAGRYYGYFARHSVIKAMLANGQGQYQAAKAHASEAMRLYATVDRPGGLVDAHIEFGNACLPLGEFEVARDNFLAALHLTKDWTTDWGMIKKASILWSLAYADVRHGQFDRGLEYCRDSLRQASRIPDRNIIADCLGLSAIIESTQGEPQRAAQLAGAALALLAAQGRKSGEGLLLDQPLPGWRAKPDWEAILTAFEAGKNMSAEQAVAFSIEAISGSTNSNPGWKTMA